MFSIEQQVEKEFLDFKENFADRQKWFYIDDMFNLKKDKILSQKKEFSEKEKECLYHIEMFLKSGEKIWYLENNLKNVTNLFLEKERELKEHLEDIQDYKKTIRKVRNGTLYQDYSDEEKEILILFKEKNLIYEESQVFDKKEKVSCIAKERKDLQQHIKMLNEKKLYHKKMIDEIESYCYLCKEMCEQTKEMLVYQILNFIENQFQGICFLQMLTKARHKIWYYEKLAAEKNLDYSKLIEQAELEESYYKKMIALEEKNWGDCEMKDYKDYKEVESWHFYYRAFSYRQKKDLYENEVFTSIGQKIWYYDYIYFLPSCEDEIIL